MKHLSTNATFQDVEQTPIEANIDERPADVTRKAIETPPWSEYVTWQFDFPAGYVSLWGKGNEDQLGYHAVGEEVFALDGVFEFGKWATLPAFSYAFHPPGWLHPSDQRSESGARVIIRRTAEEIEITRFPVPEEWDGIGFSATGGLTGARNTRPETKVWHPREERDGSPSQALVNILTRDDGNGWCTWLMMAPAGWSGGSHTRHPEWGIGDIYLLSGDLSIQGDEYSQVLRKDSYFSAAPSRDESHEVESSVDGCVALRWTKGCPPISSDHGTMFDVPPRLYG